MPHTRPMGRLRLVGIGILAVPAILWAIYQGLTWDLRDADGSAVPGFQPVDVVRGLLLEKVIGTGVTKPSLLVIVQSEIPGVVAAVHADAGDRVERGDILVELDGDRLESHVAELRAALAMAEARARYDVVGSAKVDLAQAEQEFERVARLREEQLVSRERLERTQHALERARIGLSDAWSEIAARRAAVDQAAAALRLAEKNLEKAVIRAPLDGVVIRRGVEVGSAVTDLEHGGTVIAELADDKSIHVLVQVDENDISQVREGQPAVVHIDAFAKERFDGQVRKVSWSGTGDGTMASFEVEITLDPDPRFRVGMSADVRITVGQHRDVLLVPNNAIVRTDNGPAVRRAIDGGEAHELVAVESRYSDGFQTAIGDDVIAEGDRILVMDRER